MTTITCSSSPCAVPIDAVIFPPLQLDIAAGSLIAGAIIAVWVTGWFFRTIISTFFSDCIAKEIENEDD